METFAWIPSFVTPPVETPEFRTIISKGESGSERRRSKQDTAYRTFKLYFPAHTREQSDDMFEFYRRHKGAYGAFYWWNPLVTELLINRGFETNDFTGYTQNSAVIDATEKYSGAYSSKLIASGANVTGARSDYYAVDISKIYTFGGAIKISGLTGGFGWIALHQYDASNTWVTVSYISRTSDQAWTFHEKTIGPAGSGADFTWNAATVKVKLEQYCGDTPTMNLWVDDLILLGSKRYLVRFKRDDLSREFFLPDYRAVEVELQEVAA